MLRDPIKELAEAIALLPPEHNLRLLPIMDRVKEVTRRKRRILQLVQEAISQLRLDTKYLLFDLECTREERDKALNERLSD